MVASVGAIGSRDEPDAGRGVGDLLLRALRGVGDLSDDSMSHLEGGTSICGGLLGMLGGNIPTTGPRSVLWTGCDFSL